MILLCLDSNCHSSSFGPTDNKRGDILDEFITTYNLEIENIGTEYTYKTTIANSVIDITLAEMIAVSIKN